MRKDKQKVLDEVWSDERVRSFLAARSHDAVADDFHMLLRAYRGMRAGDFERFIGFFQAEGRDVDCADPEGRTVLDIIREHRRGTEYAAALEKAGARGNRA